MDKSVQGMLQQILSTVGKAEARFSLLILLIYLVTAPPGFAGSVYVNPGTDLQSVVNNYPSGTTFELNPGVYRLQSVVPKNYDTFVGVNAGAVLNGSKLLTSFWQSGAYWVARVPVAWTSTTATICDPTHPMCDHPEDLFFDNVFRTRVVNLSQTGPGRWYLDYVNGLVYTGDNPSGHTVEISLLPHAFSGTATGVKLNELIVEKYASPTNRGAIEGVSSNQWVVVYSDVRHNHGLGLRVGNYMWVYHVKLHENGQMGIGGTGVNVSVQYNSIYYNNYDGYTFSYGGGSKFVGCYNLAVRYNNAFGNQGPGLWGDINNNYVLFEHNTTTNNRVAGILYEISYHGTIRYNTVTQDGYVPGQTSPWYGAGIMDADSAYVDIYGNVVSNCMNAIVGRQVDRGIGTNGLPYEVYDMTVHDNSVTQVSNYA